MKSNNLLFLIVFFTCTILSCRSNHEQSAQHGDLSKIKIGMTFIDVMKIAGAPDTIIHLGIVEDTFHNQTKMNEWYYGQNQVVLIVNDTVNSIDYDVRSTEELIQHIIDSARAVEGNNGASFIQPLQQ